MRSTLLLVFDSGVSMLVCLKLFYFFFPLIRSCQTLNLLACIFLLNSLSCLIAGHFSSDSVAKQSLFDPQAAFVVRSHLMNIMYTIQLHVGTKIYTLAHIHKFTQTQAGEMGKYMRRRDYRKRNLKQTWQIEIMYFNDIKVPLKSIMSKLGHLSYTWRRKARLCRARRFRIQHNYAPVIWHKGH